VGLLLAALLAAALVMTLLDFALRFPSWLRLSHLILGVAAICVVAWRWLLPVFGLCPDASTIALRLEEKDASLKGWLAAAVDLSQTRTLASATPLERALSQWVVGAARNRWRQGAVRGTLNVGPAMRSVAVLAIAIAATLVVTLASPTLARIGALRTFAPWINMSWPKRTAIVDATNVGVHPRGVALPLRAALLRSNRAPDRTDVAVRYRFVRNGEPGPMRRELLTWQRRSVETLPDAVRRAGFSPTSVHEGMLFERLIETDADAVQYTFETADDETSLQTIRLIDPPRVQVAHARFTPPAYAAAVFADSDRADFDVDMGDGRDERSVAPTALAGSTVKLTLTLNKNATASPENPDWLVQTFGEDVRGADATIAIRDDLPNVWTLTWSLVKPMRLRVALVDKYGVTSQDDSVFRFNVVEDAPATVAILTPAADRAVLPTAVVDIKAEARDDVGLANLWIERVVAKPAAAPGREPSGPGGALAPAGDAVRIARADAKGAARIEATSAVDVSTLGVKPGDEIWLTAFAEDVLAASSRARDASRSATRTLRIISQAQFIEEVQRELGAIRQDAIRIDEQQGELVDRLERVPPRINEARRGQARVGQRVDRQRDAVQRIRARLKENALDDPNLSKLLDQSKSLLSRAEDRSQNAQQALDQLAEEAAQRELDDKPQTKEEVAKLDEQVDAAKRQQQQVRDALTQIAELLDRGEDAWVARRKIEELARQQRELHDKTTELARDTAGKTDQELNKNQRSDLERIAEAQRRLAEQAREATKDLLDREQKLRNTDPAAAAGLRRAAQRASERQTSKTMEQAAEDAQRNQLGQASRAQQQAQDDLERMLEDLKQGQREREETLRRLLVTLIDSIDSLIRQQENELARLDAAKEPANAGLDRGMIAVNTNTLGVLDEASSAGPEIAPVADLLGQAVEAQTRAIVALRPRDAAALDVKQVREREDESLTLLKKAHEEAQRIENELAQQAAQRKRDELERTYREMLIKQRDIRKESTPLALKDPLSRRERRSAQQLGQREQDLIATLDKARETVGDLDEAQVFAFINERLEDALTRAIAALEQANVAASFPPQDEAISLLQGLVKALAQNRKKDDDLRDGPQGGGGGGGGQQ